jgi:DSF synthase
MPFTTYPEFDRFTEAGTLEHFTVCYEQGRHALWIFMHPRPRPCMSAAMMAEYRAIGEAMRTSSRRVDFWVLGSALPGVFNLGGDLALLLSKVQQQAREELLDYAKIGVDLMRDMLARFGTDAVTIALVEGSALGGGLEMALAHDYILAQKGAKIGFPEAAFNMFPGIGGYSLAVRRTSRRFAESIIAEGTVCGAEWFAQNGLVDEVFDKGEGIVAAQQLIDRLRARLTNTRCMLRARAKAFPVPYDEIYGIAQDWVDAAFTLEERDTAKMAHLVQLQNRKMASGKPVAQAA